MSVVIHYIWGLTRIISQCSIKWCRWPGDGDCIGCFDRSMAGAVFLSAPNDLYPWCLLDQGHSGWMRSAVDLHPTPLPWQVSPWPNEDLLDCSFTVSADGVLWG